jgi:hypothetical protein
MGIGLVVVMRRVSLIRRTGALACVVVLGSFLQPSVSQTVNVLTQHNDLTRDGANPNETILTTSNVNVSSFGKVFSLPVDGFVLAQPLYVSGVAVPGQGTHNILYVATENDSVYAFDADAGTEYWQVSLGTSVPNPPGLYLPIPIEYGITSTPVIDPISGTIYVVPFTLENGQDVYRLHALDITTGAEKFGGPVEISASVSGSAPDGSGGIVSFAASGQMQRTAVTLVNGEVYLAFSAYAEGDVPYHGWVLGYDASTLEQLQVFNDSPNGGGGGIWMGGQGFVADSSNNLYLITGNSVESSENLAGDYGEFALKLTPSGNSLTVADYFKPWNYDWMNAIDNDLGAGGAFAIPGTSDIAFGSKQGAAYLLDTNNMGGFHPGHDIIPEEWAVDNGQWGSPAFFNNAMYIWGVNDPLMAYKFNGSSFATKPSSQSAYTTPVGQTNGAISVSSNGTTPGTAIVWATAPADDPAIATVGGNLYAFDANNLANLLWSTAQNPARDGYGGFAKFTPPTIANGKVYIATNNTPGQIAVYGLLSGGVTLSNLKQTYTGSPLPVTATTVPSGLTVNITYTGVSGTIYGPTTDAPTTVGNYAVTANISDAKYTGTATGTLVISQATQTIRFTPPNSPMNYGISPVTFSATGGKSGNQVTFSIVSGPGSLSGPYNSVLTVTGTGTIVIAANQAGNTNYAAAPQVTESIVVAQFAALTAPTPSSLLTGSTATFTWSAGFGITAYALNLSAIAPGGDDLYTSGQVTRTATSVAGLPTNGTKIYARLYSVINGVSVYNDYTYSTGSLAQLTSPAPSSLLPSGAEVFTWSAGKGVSQYDLHLSAVAPGGYDLYVSGHIKGTSAPVHGLPTNGATIYARLYSVINEVTFYSDYTYATGSLAQLTFPAPSSLLTSSTVFTWSTGTGVTVYALNLSAVAPGGYDLYASGQVTRTATSVVGLPTNGTKIYARLYSVISGVTFYNDYIYATGALAQLTAPVPSSLLPNSAVVFRWSAGTGVSQYDLHLSAVAPGGYDLYVSGHITGTSTPVHGLPTNGETIYARLYSVIDGVTFYNDYTYATGSLAQLTSPAPNSLLTSSTVFTWSAGTGVKAYALNLSVVAPGGYDLYASGQVTRTATSVAGLPANGAKIYARLYSVIDGITFYNDYTFATGALAMLTSPAPSSMLTGSTVQFNWSAGTGVSQYDLHLSAVAPGGDDLYVSGRIAGRSTPVYRLPTNGETIYARLYSLIDGFTFYNDCTYQAK